MLDYLDTFCSSVERPPAIAQPGQGFWRLDKPLVDKQNRLIKGGLLPDQREWWELPNFIKGLVGGYGSGKTMTGCKRIISLALQNAPVSVATISPTFPMARKTIVVTIQELLAGKQGLFGKGFWWKFNKTFNEFRIRHRGRSAHIYVLSGEDPDSLKGPNLAAALLDEPFLMDYKVFTQTIARVRHPMAKQSEIDLVGTPEQLNWGYDLFIGELEDRYDVGLVQLSTRGNYILDPGYVKRLESAFTDKASDAYIDGKFVNLGSGTIYYGFDPLGPDKNVQDLPIPDNAELGCGMDFNVNPFAFTVFWQAGSHMHFFDEYELPNADTEYACGMLREKYTDPKRITKQILHKICPDASGSARKTSAPAGRSDFTYIRDAGFEIDAPAANPKVRDRENACNGKLRPKAGKPTITISPKCKRLIKYLTLASHELKNKPEQLRMGHLLDAFGYPVARRFPISRESMEEARLTGI